MSAATMSSPRAARKSGVSILPTHVSILPGRSENHSTAAKNTSHFAVPSSIIGLMPTENEVEAQRGMAKNGPIVR